MAEDRIARSIAGEEIRRRNRMAIKEATAETNEIRSTHVRRFGSRVESGIDGPGECAEAGAGARAHVLGGHDTGGCPDRGQRIARRTTLRCREWNCQLPICHMGWQNHPPQEWWQ